MVRLVIIDEAHEVVHPEDMTNIGLSQIIFECDRLKEELEDLYNSKQD